MSSLSEVLQPYAAVVVTGGSSGIGKSFIELGRKLKPDLRVCNLARRISADRTGVNTAGELRQVFCDLADATSVAGAADAAVAWLANEVPVGRVLLINNSGIGAFGPFPEPDLPRQLQSIDVNVRGLVDLTGRLLPALRSRGGAVLNVASTVAYQPIPYAATYAATKAFVLHWSIALDTEWRGTGLRSIALCPGTTRTEFFSSAGVAGSAVPLHRAMTAEDVAAAGYRALAGTGCVAVPGLLNRMIVAATARLPKSWAARLAARVMAGRRSVRTP